MRTDRVDHECFDVRRDDGSVARERICRGARCGSDYHAVTAYGIGFHSVHLDVDRAYARVGIRTEDYLVERDIAFLVGSFRFEHRSLLDGIISRYEPVHDLFEIGSGRLGQKSYPSEINPEYRHRALCAAADHVEHRSVASERDQNVSYPLRSVERRQPGVVAFPVKESAFDPALCQYPAKFFREHSVGVFCEIGVNAYFHMHII